MLYNKTAQFDSKAGKLCHSGYLSRSDKIEESNLVVEYLMEKCKEHKVKCSYDVTYNGFPQDLVVTECFGGHGGVIIHPADFKFSEHLMSIVEAGDRDIDFIRPVDKYALFDCDSSQDRLVILPGTNIIDRVDAAEMKKLNDERTYFKPHPITTDWWIREMKLALGPDKLRHKMASGAALISRSKEIVVSTSTELGIYARLQGKKVSTYTLKGQRRGSYSCLYSQIDRLEDVLSSPNSGVIFLADDYKEQIDQYMDFYLAELKKWRKK